MHFITISQMLGTDGEKIARKVAGDLKYAFYGEQELFKAAEDNARWRYNSYKRIAGIEYK